MVYIGELAKSYAIQTEVFLFSICVAGTKLILE